MTQINKDSAPIGITMGCPAGIGPEIILKSFNQDFHDKPGYIVIGSMNILLETAAWLGIKTPIIPWLPGEQFQKGSINILDVCSDILPPVIPGKPNFKTGTVMATYIKKAVELCNNGILSAITTCPISKTTLNEAGYHFPGHTEFLCNLTGVEQAVMMMAGNTLNIVLATIHCPLVSVPSLLNRQALEQLIALTDKTLKIDFNKKCPKIAVAGLNPHAGEDGLFGNEEKEIIEPAVINGSANGINVTGPFPPDTVFNRAASGEFDAVVCMYHDQGLIPFKLLHFSDGVNVTLGLPIVRTSVDHGTAYDIAGTGTADCRSLEAAVMMASKIAANRRRYDKQQ